MSAMLFIGQESGDLMMIGPKVATMPIFIATSVVFYCTEYTCHIIFIALFNFCSAGIHGVNATVGLVKIGS